MRTHQFLTLLLIICLGTGISSCSILGQPNGPNGTFDDQQNKAFAVASILSIGLCEDLKAQLKPAQLIEASAAANLVATTVRGTVTPDQAEHELKTLIQNQGVSKYTRTIASVIFAVSAFLPQEYKTNVGLTLIQTASQNCSDIFADPTNGGGA